jgi:hypothetical protein
MWTMALWKPCLFDNQHIQGFRSQQSSGAYISANVVISTITQNNPDILSSDAQIRSTIILTYFCDGLCLLGQAILTPSTKRFIFLTDILYSIDNSS